MSFVEFQHKNIFCKQFVRKKKITTESMKYGLKFSVSV